MTTATIQGMKSKALILALAVTIAIGLGSFTLQGTDASHRSISVDQSNVGQHYNDWFYTPYFDPGFEDIQYQPTPAVVDKVPSEAQDGRDATD